MATKAYASMDYRSDRLVSGLLFTHYVEGEGEDGSSPFADFLGRGDGLVPLPGYEGHRCRVCGRLDELACLRAGIREDFVLPRRRTDVHYTRDGMTLWSRRLADVIALPAPEMVMLFDVPGEPDYVAPWPTREFRVPIGTRIYVSGEKPTHTPGEAFHPRTPPCPVCGRYHSCTYWDSNFIVPGDVSVAASIVDADVDPHLISSVCWILRSEIAIEIKNGGFTNVRIYYPFAGVSDEKGIMAG